MAAITICSDFGAQKNNVSHCSPSISHEVMGPNAMIFVFRMLSFKPTFLLSSFTFTKRLFSFSSLSAIRVVSSAYLSAKECSNHHTIALISHTGKVMLKILQARLQQYVNRELPDVQTGFRKDRGTRDQITNIRWIIMEKTMAPHSSTLAWKIPWMEEPGGLQSMGSLRVGHDWGTSLSLFTFMHWRRK